LKNFKAIYEKRSKDQSVMIFSQRRRGGRQCRDKDRGGKEASKRHHEGCKARRREKEC